MRMEAKLRPAGASRRFQGRDVLVSPPEQLDLAERHEQILHRRAARHREETAAKRDEWELTRDKVLFLAQIGLGILTLLTIVAVLVSNPHLIAPTVVGGGILQGARKISPRTSN